MPALTESFQFIREYFRSSKKKRYDEAKQAGSKYLITCTDGVTHKKNATEKP